MPKMAAKRLSLWTISTSMVKGGGKRRGVTLTVLRLKPFAPAIDFAAVECRPAALERAPAQRDTQQTRAGARYSGYPGLIPRPTVPLTTVELTG